MHSAINYFETSHLVSLTACSTYFSPALQGLVTNDVTKLDQPQTTPIYTCILNAQGRYLHDLILHPLPSTTTELPAVLLETDANGSDDLLRLLKRYRLRQKIEIDEVSEEHEVWSRFNPEKIIRNETTHPELPSASAGNNSTAAANDEISWPRDPRLSALGYRAILPSGSAAPKTVKSVPWEAYRRWRISQGVAEGDSEIPTGDAIALEYNIDGLHGISFTKGCYVGQELMARTHFKGVVRKRVMPFEIMKSESSTPGGGGDKLNILIDSGESVIDGTSGKVLGSVRVVDGGQGLAHLRLKEAHEAIDGLRVLKTESGVEIRPWRPQWWPEIWGREG